ncbi:MAG: VCBS repeat-containing protein [Pseudomonadota bacterium]
MRVSALFLLATPALADPVFEPVEVPQHVYDGGWEHFVGGGLAVLDCDENGLPDMVAAGGTNELALLRNAGNMRFRMESLGISGTIGAYPIDVDSDGHLDLVVLRVGPDVVLQGDGACGFTPMGLLPFEDRWTTAFSATWETGATLPTLAFGHYVNRADPDGPFEACDTNILWRPGPEGYVASTLAPGHCPLSALFTDWARTGRADLRLSNDRHYYVSAGSEQMWRMAEAPRLLAAQDGWQTHKLWGMGIAARDIDRDGRDEVFLSSMGDQRLMVQGEGATFTDVPFVMGSTAHRPYTGGDGRPSTGWHIAFGDVQNDGWDDAFIAKGNVQQMPGLAMEDPNNLLVFDGTRFREVGDVAGIASMHRARGAALVDFDGDGRLDLAVVNRRAPLEVWRNVTPDAGAWLTVALSQDGANTRGVGAWIEVNDGRTVQSREVVVGGGHAGGVAGPQHFGLGDIDLVRVRVLWPGAEAWTAWQETRVNRAMRLTRDR